MYLLGRLFQWLRLPGMVRPMSFFDKTTGQRITIKTSPRYTIIQVGGTEHFFIRETGKYDGHGQLEIG